MVVVGEDIVTIIIEAVEEDTGSHPSMVVG